MLAVTKKGKKFVPFKVPLFQELQKNLAHQWLEQYENFTDNVEYISFDSGYNPEPMERFYIDDFKLPDWLEKLTRQTVTNLESIGQNEKRLNDIKALICFVQLECGKEVTLFQNFSKSHVISPGRSLLLKKGVYTTNTSPILTIKGSCSAVYKPNESRLIFEHFRSVNVFLPLAEYYEEAAEEEIKTILSHNSLSPENIESIANGASQWFRKRFAILRDSKILDTYSVQHIIDHSQGYDIEITVKDEKIVFPKDKIKAKRLLQFLNEEIYRGAITEKLYETNSKRESD